MGRGKAQKTLDLVVAAREILSEIQPASVRAICYRLFVAGLIPSMARKETGRVSRILVDAREQGDIPWEWIVDETRGAERPGTWKDPKSFAEVALQSFRRDRWAYQPARVEVWSEKGTVRGTLAPVLHNYGVTFRSFSGFTSATSIMDILRDVYEQGKPFVALYVGDHDPSGLYMSEWDIPRRLDKYSGGEDFPLFKMGRIALTREDCNDLPSFDVEAKSKDPRYQWYKTLGHNRGWELDAMSPPVLRDRVEAAIVSRIDLAAWDRTGLAEAAEQSSLKSILGEWPGSISRQVSE